MKNTQKIMIDTENQMVDYILTRKNVKNINMHIDADGKVRVSANSKIGIDEINHFVMEHTGFINKAVSNNAKRKTLYPDKKLNIGMAAETSDIYTILGKQYFLKIIETNKEEVCLDEKEKNIVLYTRNAQIIRHNDMLIMDFLKKKQKTYLCRPSAGRQKRLNTVGWLNRRLLLRIWFQNGGHVSIMKGLLR